MKKNGFTLIELLAIIVILAIIAVITVPIILNVIDNAERGSAEDSALGYKDALQKYYATKLVQAPDQELPSGYVEISELPSDFTVSGEKPSDGWVKLKNGIVEKYSLKYKNFVVSMNNDKNVISEKQDKVEPHVPSDYQEVEFLESTGTQYIDTGYFPNNNTKVDIKFMALDSNPSGAVPLFGTRSSNAKKSYTTFYKTSNIGSGRTDFGDQFGGTSVINFQPNTIYSYIKNKEKNYLNDINISNNDVYEFQTDYPLYLYDINSAGVSYGNGTNNNRFFGNIYYTKIYDDDLLVRNFVPVIRKSDGKPGMLDLANLSKNLAPDFSSWEYGYISAIGGISGMNNVKQEKTSPFIEIDSITNITFSLDSGVFPSIGTEWEQRGWRTFGFYDENKSFISRVGGNGENALTVTVPSNAKYFRISMRTFGKNENVMLNEGSTALPYEPYKKSFYTNDGTGEFIAGPEI